MKAISWIRSVAIILAILLIPIQVGHAEETVSLQDQVRIVWQKSFGESEYNKHESARDIQETSDGGYIIGGNDTQVINSNGDRDTNIHLIKTDQSGNQLWEKTIGDYKSGESVESVQQTEDGGYILAGSITEPWKNPAIYLIKTDSQGNIEWQQKFQYSTKGSYGSSVLQTNDKGYVFVGGAMTENSNAPDQVYVVKTDRDGNKLWDNIYGGASQEKGYSIQQTADNGYLVLGETRSTDKQQMYLLKLNESGGELWSKTFSNSTTGRVIKKTADNGYILAGQTYSYGNGSNDTDFYLTKISAYGYIQWEKALINPGPFDDVYSLSLTDDNGFIVAGSTRAPSSTYTDFYVVKTDQNGNMQWKKGWGGSKGDIVSSVQQTQDGGYILTGFMGNWGVYEGDIPLIKLSDSAAPQIKEMKVKSAFFDSFRIDDAIYLGTSADLVNQNTFYFKVQAIYDDGQQKEVTSEIQASLDDPTMADVSLSNNQLVLRPKKIGMSDLTIQYDGFILKMKVKCFDLQKFHIDPYIPSDWGLRIPQYNIVTGYPVHFQLKAGEETLTNNITITNENPDILIATTEGSDINVVGNKTGIGTFNAFFQYGDGVMGIGGTYVIRVKDPVPYDTNYDGIIDLYDIVILSKSGYLPQELIENYGDQ